MADKTANKDEQKKKKTDSQQSESVESSGVEQQLDDLTKKLEEVDQKRDEAVRIAQRAQADYANLRRRFEKEREEIGAYAIELLLVQLLPAIDNLDRAVHYASDEEKSSALFMGVKMTLQQMHDSLGGAGLEKIEVSAGDAFDPNIHEAIEVIEGDKDKIVEVLQTGYKIGDRVIRAAKVKVGNGGQ